MLSAAAARSAPLPLSGEPVIMVVEYVVATTMVSADPVVKVEKRWRRWIS